MRLAGQKQEELELVTSRIEQLQTGQTGNSDKPAEISELAQSLAPQYVTFGPTKKRQVVDSVLLNLQLSNVTLCADYRLPFSILVENGTRPLDSG